MIIVDLNYSLGVYLVYIGFGIIREKEIVFLKVKLNIIFYTYASIQGQHHVTLYICNSILALMPLK
jgi:hypothetical protein